MPMGIQTHETLRCTAWIQRHLSHTQELPQGALLTSCHGDRPSGYQ